MGEPQLEKSIVVLIFTLPLITISSPHAGGVTVAPIEFSQLIAFQSPFDNTGELLAANKYML
jgi:hypothetical protein